MSHRSGLWRRSVDLPADHGAWVFLLSPLVIGLFVGGRWSTSAFYLIVASLCGFLSRQPLTVAVKALSGRRPRADLPPAVFWALLYAGVGLLHVAGLVMRGMGYLLYLAVPGIVVFAWYLHLVRHRDERRQLGLEILGAGVLALNAPAGLWAGLGQPEPIGWLLWLLTWAQSAASIVFVYLRLAQRPLLDDLGLGHRLRMGLPVLGVTTLNLFAVTALGIDQIVSGTLFLAYLPQWLEAVAGTLRPAYGTKPTRIGVRQMVVSALYTLLFVACW